MPRQTVEENYTSFAAGLVTEGTKLSRPKNAAISLLNMEVQKADGAVYKRKGINIESGETAVNGVSVTDTKTYATNDFEWLGAGGDPTANFYVCQIGKTIQIFEKGTDYMTGSSLSNLTLATFVSGHASPETEQVQFANINGLLLIQGPHIKLHAISYDGSFTAHTNVGTIQTRVFERANDGVSVDAQSSVIVLALTGTSGNYSDGETITGGTSGATAVVLHDSGTPPIGVLQVDLVSGTFQVGETITGGTSGSTGTFASTTGTGLSDDHRWNLYNQGWTTDTLRAYAVATNTWPSNAQVWFQSLTSGGAFDAGNLDNYYFGTTEAPNGSYIYDEFYETVPSGSGFPATIRENVGNEPRVIGTYAGRVVYGGVASPKHSTNLYFSPVIDKLDPSAPTASTSEQLFQCYQKNDPTGEIYNTLLATDGLVMRIPQMNHLTRLVDMHVALFAVAKNGVWMITGADQTSGFSAEAQTVTRISNIGTEYVEGVVLAGNGFLFWNDAAVYACFPDDRGNYQVTDVSTIKIKSTYQAIPKVGKQAAKGYYDEFNNRVYWAYNSNSAKTKIQRESMLIFDLDLGAFYPYTLSTPMATYDYNPFVLGMTQDVDSDSTAANDGKPPVKVFCYAQDGTRYKMLFAEFNDGDTWIDWADYNSGTEFANHVTGWPDTLGTLTRKKQSVWVDTYMVKTEDGFTDLGGGVLEANHQSSCQMYGAWDWHNSDAAGRWTTAREIYRHAQPYIPVDDTDTYDSGEDIIHTRNKVYGRGLSLALRFDGVAGKDMKLNGYAIPYTVDGAP